MNTNKHEYAFMTWDEIMFGVFIEATQISDNVMKSVDDDIESIMKVIDK